MKSFRELESESLQKLNQLQEVLPENEREREIVSVLQTLYPAVIADILDKKGYRNQVVSPAIEPLWPDVSLAGVVTTIECHTVDGLPDEGEEYKVLFEAIDRVQKGHVVVTNKVESCIWGELMSEATVQRGGRGIVTEGYTRDTLGILELGFPVFCLGKDCRDVLGRAEAVAFDVPINCAGVEVRPKDFVIGNVDGVVFIPNRIAEETVNEALEKANGEKIVQKKLREGLSTTEAWKKYGIM